MKCHTRSWKSGVAAYDTYTVGMGKRSRYAVPVTHLGKCLKPHHTIVKVDVEGSEMSVLTDTIEWGACEILVFEYSVARCRRFGLGWRPFAMLLDKLLAGGFTHVHIPKEMYDSKWWISGTCSFTESMDSLCCCYRPSADDRAAVLGQFEASHVQKLQSDWRTYRAHMLAQ